MPRVCIFLPVSRSTHLQRVFSALEFLQCDASQTNLVAYVDGDAQLTEQCRTMAEASKFATRVCKQRPSWNAEPQSRYSIPRRRLRIAAIKNESKGLIQECDYVLSLEDDSIPPTNTLTKLVQDYAYYPYAGCISGVQVGRWGVNHLGVWKTDDPYDTNELTSLMPGEGMQEVDAAGFFCYLTTRDRYMGLEYKPYEGNAFGPDVAWGTAMRRLGYKNYVDWGVRVDHLRDDGSVINVTNTELVSVSFRKNGDHWMQSVA